MTTQQTRGRGSSGSGDGTAGALKRRVRARARMAGLEGLAFSFMELVVQELGQGRGKVPDDVAILWRDLVPHDLGCSPSRANHTFEWLCARGLLQVADDVGLCHERAVAVRALLRSPSAESRCRRPGPVFDASTGRGGHIPHELCLHASSARARAWLRWASSEPKELESLRDHLADVAARADCRLLGLWRDGDSLSVSIVPCESEQLVRIDERLRQAVEAFAHGRIDVHG